MDGLVRLPLTDAQQLRHFRDRVRDSFLDRRFVAVHGIPCLLWDSARLRCHPLAIYAAAVNTTASIPALITATDMRPLFEAVSHLREAQGHVVVRKPEEWLLVWLGDDPLFVGVGEQVEYEFGAKELMSLYDWLRAADWLRPLEYATAPKTDDEFLAAGGKSIVEVHRLLTDLGAIDVEPEVALPTEEEVLGLLEGVPLPTAKPAIRIRDTHLTLELAALRRGIQLAAALRGGELPLLFADLEPLFAEIGLGSLTRDMFQKLGPIEAARYLARAWFAVHLNGAGLTAITLPDDSGPARLIYKPLSALHAMWLAVAMAGDAIVPDVNIPGVFTCAYARCRKTFTRTRTRVKGTNRFCSKVCGNKFHAAASKRKQRARERAARLRPDGGS